jgi:hypothetical protein
LRTLSLTHLPFLYAEIIFGAFQNTSTSGEQGEGDISNMSEEKERNDVQNRKSTLSLPPHTLNLPSRPFSPPLRSLTLIYAPDLTDATLSLLALNCPLLQDVKVKNFLSKEAKML